MRRLSRTDRIHVNIQAYRRYRKFLRRRKNKRYRTDEFLISAPAILSFSQNGDRTIDFFDRFKVAVFERARIEKSGVKIRRRFGIDLKPIKRISVPAAVILAAEMHLWSRNSRGRLSPRNYRMWSPRVKALLTGLGAFELLGLATPAHGCRSRMIKALPRLSCSSCYQEKKGVTRVSTNCKRGLLSAGLFLKRKSLYLRLSMKRF